jgi:biofilm protein TabA
MIIDRLEHARMYRPLAVDIARALDYLQQTDLRALADGRYELDGDRLFAMVQRYRPKPVAEATWEAHRQYIDVQYILDGRERMGYTYLRGDLRVRQLYDAQKDVIFFDAAGDMLDVPAGSFVIFTPHDVHAPGLTTEPAVSVQQVVKIVVKCRVRE